MYTLHSSVLCSIPSLYIQLGERACSIASRVRRSSKSRVWMLVGDLQCLAGQRGPRGERLDATVVGAVALAGRPVQVDHGVTQLGPGADRAAVELVAQDQPAADAGPNGQHHRLAAAAGGARPVLGQGSEVGVV